MKHWTLFAVTMMMTVAAVAADGQALPQGGGRAGGPGTGRGGRGCPPPAIPAAETCIAPGGPTWASPVLPESPILVQSAVSQHRDLRVSSPWVCAALVDDLAPAAQCRHRGPGRLRVVRHGFRSSSVPSARVHAQGLQGLRTLSCTRGSPKTATFISRTTSRSRSPPEMARKQWLGRPRSRAGRGMAAPWWT